MGKTLNWTTQGVNRHSQHIYHKEMAQCTAISGNCSLEPAICQRITEAVSYKALSVKQLLSCKSVIELQGAVNHPIIQHAGYRLVWEKDTLAHGWLGSLVAKALELQLAGCEFNSRPRRCRVTTSGKLFTPMCLSRSQWFSDGMIDCGVRGRGQLCLLRQPLRCTALGTGCAPFLQCLGRLSLPPSVGW